MEMEFGSVGVEFVGVVSHGKKVLLVAQTHFPQLAANEK